MKLDGKIAIITGAGSGLGRAIALQMAKEGARIGVNDVNEQSIEQTLAELKKQGAEGLGLLADVSSADAVRGMFDKLSSTWGGIDILVNNAGFGAIPSWSDYTQKANAAFLARASAIAATGRAEESMEITSDFKDAYWHKMIDVHLNGTFYCTREALKMMEKRRSGRIINMSSICGMAGSAGAPSYSAAKAGILGFTKSVAVEVAPAGICVNAVAPGYVETPLLDTLDPMVKQMIIAQTPAGRMGTPEEIAGTVVFLATDQAAFFVGQVLSPNGGMVI